MRNVYIVGGTGYIGSAALKVLRERELRVKTIGSGSNADIVFDLSSPDFEKIKEVKQNSFILMAAAISSPDYCENNYHEAYQINVAGTSSLIEQLVEKNCDVVFLSSDAVFSSQPGEVFNEDSQVSPISAYGEMKAEIENIFANTERFKTLRLSYVFSDHDKMMNYMLQCMKDKKKAEIFHPYYRNYISLSDVVKTIIYLEENWEAFPDWKLNLAGTELISRIRVADELKQLFPDFNYSVIEAEADFYKSRARVTQMESKYLYSLGICKPECFTKKFIQELKGINND